MPVTGEKGLTMREPEEVTAGMVFEATGRFGLHSAEARQRLETLALVRYVEGIGNPRPSGHIDVPEAIAEIKLVLKKLIERG